MKKKMFGFILTSILCVFFIINSNEIEASGERDITYAEDIISKQYLGNGIDLASADGIDSKNMKTTSIFDYDLLVENNLNKLNHYDNNSLTIKDYMQNDLFSYTKDVAGGFGFGNNISASIEMLSLSATKGLSYNFRDKIATSYAYAYYYRRLEKSTYKLALTKEDDYNIYSKCLSEAFVQNLEKLKNGSLSFENFFGLYGTHVLVSGNYGGRLEDYTEIYSNYDSFDSSEITDLHSFLSAKYLSIEGGNTFDINKKTLEKIKESHTSVVSSVISTGGYQSINTATSYFDYTKWLDSLSPGKPMSNSSLIGANENGVVPVWKYIPNTSDYDNLRSKMENKYYYYAQSKLYSTGGGTPYIKTFDVNYYDGGSHKITDQNEYEQQKGYKILFTMGLKELEYYGYNAVKLKVTFDVSEIDDGYQEVSIYSGSKRLDMEQVEHYPGKKISSPKSYTVNFQELLYSFDGQNGISIYYGASGKKDDDWYISNISITATFFRL